MRIVSTTLAGGACAENIGDALSSVVDHVDACIVIDTGITDNSLDVARQVCGEKLHVVNWPWAHDFAKARNMAAQVCATEGDWQIFVDTDERIQGAENLRGLLERAPADFYMVMETSRTYVRERIFRLPIKGSWSGPTHEAYIDGGNGQVITSGPHGVMTYELPKTEHQLHVKFMRDKALLEAYTSTGAIGERDPRWWYYLGDSLANLRMFEDASFAFNHCASLRGWNEQGAWACYRSACCYAELAGLQTAEEKRREYYEKARAACLVGLSIHAGVAELAWYAGWLSDRLGEPHNTVAWANMARANGLYDGDGERFKRLGFRFLPGLYEGPFDLIRWNLPAGEEQVAADQKWVDAFNKRNGRGKYAQGAP